MQSLLFSFLDELLFVFLTELLVCKHVTISTFDQAGWVILAEGCAYNAICPDTA